jgi:hypothetical protein
MYHYDAAAAAAAAAGKPTANLQVVSCTLVRLTDAGTPARGSFLPFRGHLPTE